PASLGLAPTENVASFGMAALRRLDLIVDGKNAVAYLRPKKTPASPPAYQPDGPSAAFAPHDEKGDDLVAHVANASPAYTAGNRAALCNWNRSKQRGQRGARPSRSHRLASRQPIRSRTRFGGDAEPCGRDASAPLRFLCCLL